MEENYQERHTMVLVKQHENGADEWYCPTCGRRFIMQWPPRYKKIILEAGDEFAQHTGSHSDASMQSPEILESEAPVAEKDSYLEPFEKWLDQVDFEAFWKDGD